MDPLLSLVRALLPADDSAAGALLSLLRPHLDDDMLQQIADADWGMNADLNLARLRQIRDDGAVFAPMDWEPREVLSLVRWSEPADPNAGPRDDFIRAFVCAALLRTDAEPENQPHCDSENETLAQLVAASISLSGEFVEGATRFLAWKIAHVAIDEERPCFAFALLLLVVLRRARYAEEEVGRLAEAVVAEAGRVQERMREHRTAQPGWILCLTHHNQKHHLWQRHGRRLLAEAEKFRSPTVRAWLTEIGRGVVECF
jgi:hypothetical protein